LQLCLFPEEFADYPAIVNYLLTLAQPDDSDVIIPSPSSSSLNPGEARMIRAADEILTSAVDTIQETIVDTRENEGEEAATELRAEITAGRGTLEPEIGGQSLNAVINTLVMHAARHVIKNDAFLRKVCATVRWAFENVPRNVLVALAEYWGDMSEDGIAQLELARAFACMQRQGQGMRLTAIGMPEQEVCADCGRSRVGGTRHGHMVDGLALLELARGCACIGCGRCSID
jgi:hypothetical protein